MIASKKLIEMARKWRRQQPLEGKELLQKGIIKIPGLRIFRKKSIVDKGCCVIYTMDKRRFEIPLAFLGNCIFSQLLKMSEEEFGLPSDGPITLPCDSVVMNCIVSLLKRGLSKDMERALLNSIATYSCSSNTYFNEVHADQQSFMVSK